MVQIHRDPCLTADDLQMLSATHNLTFQSTMPRRVFAHQMGHDGKSCSNAQVFRRARCKDREMCLKVFCCYLLYMLRGEATS